MLSPSGRIPGIKGLTHLYSLAEHLLCFLYFFLVFSLFSGNAPVLREECAGVFFPRKSMIHIIFVLHAEEGLAILSSV